MFLGERDLAILKKKINMREKEYQKNSEIICQAKFTSQQRRVLEWF
jgi:hypothetical protein